MRAFTRHALVAAAVTTVGVSIWACDAKKQTEYVAGVSTQVQVPRDLKTVRVDINVGGASVFCRAYKVYDGKVQLPRSLGSFPASGNANGDPVTVTVVGFTEDAEDVQKQDIYSCLQTVNAGVAKDANNNAQNARILRRSRQPYVQDEILFLPMPLKFACFDQNCETAAQNMTCKAGRCVDAVTDQSTLPTFSPDLLDGTGGGCFHASQCFQGALPAATVNADDCTFAIPNTPSSPPLAVDAGALPQIDQQGLNVQIVWDGGFTQEILDKDPTEGFIVPDPAKPQQFRLAPGLCDFYKGFDNQTPPQPKAHRITGIFASPICQPKGPFQPLCANDQLAAMGVDTNGVGPTPNQVCNSTEVKPPTSLLMVVADATTRSQLFYQDAADLTVKLSLSDPAFDSTQIGLIFAPESPGDAACSKKDPAVPLTSARDAKPLIAKKFSDEKGALFEGPVGLEGALRTAYDTLTSGADPSIYRRAVFVIGNRDLNADPSLCTGVDKSATQAAAHLADASKPVKTYVALLARDRDSTADDPAPLVGANQLAQAGSSVPKLNAFDARGGNQAAAAQAFQSIVEDLATCVYDVPETQLKTTNVFAYQDPLNPLTGNKTITNSASCNESTQEQTGTKGWGFATNPSNQAAPGRKRIVLCGDDCTGYRTVRQNAANQAALYLQSPPAVPVYTYDAACTVNKK